MILTATSNVDAPELKSDRKAQNYKPTLNGGLTDTDDL